ncbi:MAG: bifunctional adenosylcobinamide kinase/adenosylcobinamide-phosphate guanylyltransferase [Pseudomonadota bacterium]
MIELIGGGARSGKSRFALQRAAAVHASLNNGHKVFIATAQPLDHAMRERIEAHRAERDKSWTLIEQPLDLAASIRALNPSDCAVVDCLTLWVTNWLMQENPENWQSQRSDFLQALVQTPSNVFIVTNEVGHGVTPLGQLSRDFVDESGFLHQAIAELADNVTMMQFGIPQFLKTTTAFN